MSRALLAMNDVCFSYRSYGPQANKLILKQIHFRIYAGEKIALLGANGAGKSSLLLLCNGLHQPQSGQILWQNHPLEYTKRKLQELRTQVALVLQNPDEQLFAPTVAEDLSFGPINLGLEPLEIQLRIDKILQELKIENLRDSAIHTLSLGQRKKVALAGVLIMQPKLIVMDEPSTGLDPWAESQLFSILAQKCDAGMGLLFSTHDVDLAWHFADRVIVLKEGSILCDGEPKTVLSNSRWMCEAGLRLPYSFHTPTLKESI